MSCILGLWEYNIERNPLYKKTVRKVWTKHYLAPWYKMSECMCPGYAPYMFEIKRKGNSIQLWVWSVMKRNQLIRQRIWDLMRFWLSLLIHLVSRLIYRKSQLFLLFQLCVAWKKAKLYFVNLFETKRYQIKP